MGIPFNIWGRAMLIYIVCMLPTLLIPIIFGYAVGLALLWGIPALAVFMAGMAGARSLNWFIGGSGFIVTVLCGMGLCFAATYAACRMMTENNEHAFAAMSRNFGYPLVAWLSAAISLITYRRYIRNYFTQNIQYVL